MYFIGPEGVLTVQQLVGREGTSLFVQPAVEFYFCRRVFHCLQPARLPGCPPAHQPNAMQPVFDAIRKHSVSRSATILGVILMQNASQYSVRVGSVSLDCLWLGMCFI